MVTSVSSEEKAIDRVLDLRGEVCPYTLVKTKLTLEDMEPGQVLRVVLDYPPAAQSVPRSLRLYGQEVIAVRKISGHEWEVITRKV